MFLKNFAKFTGKHLCQSLFFNKVAGLQKVRMETTCTLNESKRPTLESMIADVYSLSTDGSNDTDLEKMNLLTAKLYDVNTSQVVTNFIDMCCTTGPTGGQASSIFDKI